MGKIINFKNMKKAKVSNKDNVFYVLKDKYGNVKKLFQRNWLAKMLHKHFGIVTSESFLFGKWVDKMKVSNLVTTAGKAAVAGKIGGVGTVADFEYIAIGTGTNAAAAGDTTLQTEITTNGGERDIGTASLVTTDTTNDTLRVTLTFNFTGSFAVTESGLFNDASAGTLLARQVFSAINVISGDSLAMTWNVDVD